MFLYRFLAKKWQLFSGVGFVDGAGRAGEKRHFEAAWFFDAASMIEGEPCRNITGEPGRLFKTASDDGYRRGLAPYGLDVGYFSRE